MTRLFWLALGFGSLFLAVLGVVLPILPATPFLLVSAFSFARSSPRLHDWLVEHPRLGPPIKNWRSNRSIPRNIKIAAVAVMIATFAFSLVMGVSNTVLIIQAVVMSAAAAFVISRPIPMPDSDLKKGTLRKQG